MIGELQRYIDPAYTYNFYQGPKQVPDEAAARHSGINCVALAHLALQSTFGSKLPVELHCYEMFIDAEHFTTIEATGRMQAGDVVWFGQSPASAVQSFLPRYDAHGYLLNWRNSPVSHVAVHIGDHQDGQPLLLHATHIAGTNVVWPLGKFAAYPRYRHVRRMARLIR